MGRNGEHCCPSCGSEEAVAKSVAWDAKSGIPPQVAKELDRLHKNETAAMALITSSPHPGDEETVVTTVLIEMLKILSDASGIA